MDNTPKYLLILLILSSLSFFGCGKSPEQINRENLANQSLKTLQKLEAATQVNASKAEYQSLLIEAKTAVNQANEVLPDGELKAELNAAMESFNDANSFGFDPKAFVIFTFADEKLKAINKKYGLTESPENILGKDAIENGVALKIIWKVASEHVQKANNLAIKR